MRIPEQLIVIVGFGLVGACGDNHVGTVDASTIDAVPRQTVSDHQTLLPGMLVEGSWLAGSTDQVGLSLGTTALGFDWDIHGHAGGGTQEVVDGFGQLAITYVFDPPQQAQWYLLIRNSGDTALSIDVHMDLYGQAQWNGWQ